MSDASSPTDRPPSSNTGVENTYTLAALVDWLSFTIANEINPYDLLEVKRNEFVAMPKGKLGYRKQTKCGNITVLTDGFEEMHTHIIFSGQGCREYEQRINGDWQGFINHLLEVQASITRIDIALDDKSGLVDLEIIEEKVKRSECISRFRNSTITAKYDISTGAPKGKTIYFGAPSSMLKVRIYDKAAEQQVDGIWRRIEVEARKDRAQVLGLIIAEGLSLGQTIAGILKNYIRFIEPKQDRNKARWHTSAWWDEIIGAAEKIKLTTEKPKRTIEGAKDWIKKQVAPTLATVLTYEGGDIEWLTGVVRQGKARMGPRHYNLLAGADEEFTE
jgi:phage replication initiation protein